MTTDTRLTADDVRGFLVAALDYWDAIDAIEATETARLRGEGYRIVTHDDDGRQTEDGYEVTEVRIIDAETREVLATFPDHDAADQAWEAHRWWHEDRISDVWVRIAKPTPPPGMTEAEAYELKHLAIEEPRIVRLLAGLDGGDDPTPVDEVAAS